MMTQIPDLVFSLFEELSNTQSFPLHNTAQSHVDYGNCNATIMCFWHLTLLSNLKGVLYCYHVSLTSYLI